MKKMKILNGFIIFMTMILNTVFLFQKGFSDTSRLGPILSLYVILLLPFLMRKLFSVSFHPVLELVYLSFLFIAQFLGSVVNLYSKIAWYDLFAHTISGFLSGYVAIYLLNKVGHYKEKNLFFQITYILGFVFFASGFWEICEFSFDQILGSNTQHAIETGVMDTMEDMIVAAIGGLVFIISYSYEVLKDKILLTRGLTRFMK